MSPTTVRQSIEALYQEAEAVVAEEGPMLAIVKSPPANETPSNPAAELRNIAAIHAEARSARTSDDSLPLKERIKNLLADAEEEWDSSQEASTKPAQQQSTSTGQEIAAEPIISPAQVKTTPDDTAADNTSTDKHTTHGATTLSATETPQKTNIEPIESPAPAPPETRDELQPEDVDTLVSQAQTDVHAVMADIAAAVGTVPPVKSSESQTDATQNDTISMDRQTLQTLIRDTVRSVVSEELPKIVEAAIGNKNELQIIDLKAGKKVARKAAAKTTTKTAKKTKAKATG
tara:strand:+ start:646 stop:1512 length:867 start_codon:yes stop_codon:yes gene_type:complete